MRAGHSCRLLAYGAAVLAATLVHRPWLLATALVLAVLLSGAERGRLLWRALKGVLVINLLISTGYVAMGLIQGELLLRYLLLLNLRVLLLAFLTAWMLRTVNLDRALAPFPTACRWLAVVRIQIQLFRRLAQDYRQAQESRGTAAPGLIRRYRALGAMGTAALDKAVYNAEAVTQGMRSRGAFDEDDGSREIAAGVISHRIADKDSKYS
jgi:cobalt/nickel transport system permease protein